MSTFDLRPLRLGEILDRTFSLYRQHFLLFLAICGIPQLLSLALGLARLWAGMDTASNRGAGHLVFSFWTPLGIVLGLLALVVGILVYLLSQGGTVVAVSEIYLGRSTSISAALRRAWSEAASLFGVVVLNGLAISVSFIALIIPGFYVACRLLVCVPAALIEGRGPGDSLSRSWNLTKGFAGRAFAIYLLYFVIAIGIEALVNIPFGLAINASKFNAELVRDYTMLLQVFNTAITVLVEPVLLIASSVFYFDLRVRKEAFDLQFMMDPDSERIARGGDSVPSILP